MGGLIYSTSLPLTAKRSLRTMISPAWWRLLIAAGVGCTCLAAAFLIVAGNWHIAVALVFFPPVIIILHRYPFLALILWLVLSPFLVQTPSTIERQIYWIIHRLLPPLTLGLVLLSTLLRIRTRGLPRIVLPELAMGVYGIVSLLSIMTENNSPAETLYRFYDRVFIPMCLYWVLRLSAPGSRWMKWFVPVAIGITVTQVAFGVLSWYMPQVLPSSWLTYAGARTTGSLNSVSVYSTTLIFTGLILFFAATNLRRQWQRLALFFLALSTIYAIFISHSRACWLAGILVLLGVFLLYPRYLVRLALLMLPVMLFFSETLLGSQLLIAQQRLDSDQTALSRLPVIVAAYRMFIAKPLTGWGYANFDRYDRHFQGRFGDLVNPDEKDLTSHNMYMTLLAEQGLVGFTLFLTPVLALMVQTIKVYNSLPKRGWTNRRLLFLLWLVILSHVVVNNLAPMVVVFGLGIWWLTLGWIATIVYSPQVIG